MITIHQTFETITHESAENGDFADSGFVMEGESVSFRELVALMKSHPQPSTVPVPLDGARVWLTSYPETNYCTGEEATTSIHFADNPRKWKYWLKAMQAAGVVK
jgi:hypothetical protein